MRRTGVRARVVAIAAALAALALAGPAAAGPSGGGFEQFRTPSGNIGCGYGDGVLRCDIGTGLVPQPPKPRGCELDWGFGYSMSRTGRARVVCAGDTVLDPRAKVLAYGRTWTRGGFTCTSRTNGLRCVNRSGHGWTIARGASRRF